MFLFYVFKDGSWEFWESIRWFEFFDFSEAVVDDINSYLGLHCELEVPFNNLWNIDYDRFLYDMIHYKQYVSNHVVIYYLDIPGGING